MLNLATTTWDDAEKDALYRVIDSGMFSMGKYVLEFEQAFANYIGSEYAVMVNSGSSANLLAVAALFYSKEHNLKPGDEIIVPAVSWSTTYYPLQQYGLKLKFVDVDINTFNLDLEQVEQAITDKTRAIFAVNLLGNPLDYNKLNNIIKNKNIILLEDNCESMGAVLDNKQAGTFGLLGTFSTFFSHHISTMEGGLIVTNNEELYHIMLSMRAHGWTRNLPSNNKICTKSNNPFEESFKFILPGYNIRPIEMSGALGLEQLKKLPNILAGRRNNAKVFKEEFGSIDNLLIQQEVPNASSSWFGFAMIVDAGDNSNNIRDKLVNVFTKNNIECRPIVAGNFVKNPVIEYFDYAVYGELINSDKIDSCGVFVGNHHYDISKELQAVAKLVKEQL